MKSKALGAFVLFCGMSTAFAASAPVKVADCTAAPDGNSPAQHIQVFRDGSNINDKSEYSVQYDAGTLSTRLPVDAMEWQDGGKTLSLQCEFLLLLIKDGTSTANQIGVELGAPPQPMTCTASF